MKKLIAILLLCCHLFYTGGALAVHAFLNYRANQFYNEQAGKGLYNTNELTEVVIPVKLNQTEDWKTYESISGHIQFGEHSYNYVKLKLTRNAMYLMCVPGYEKTRLISQNVIDAKGAKETPVPARSHVPQFKMMALASFHFSFARFAFSAPIKELKMMVYPSTQQASLRSLDIPEQPPRLAC